MALYREMEDISMYEEYFLLTEKHKKEQGERTVVLMQCGVFFEVYGTEIEGDFADVTKLCSLSAADKKVGYKGQHLYMAGFRDFMIDKYLPILLENDYTVVVYVQTGETKNKKLVRKMDAIYSVGTHISETRVQNHVMVVWIEKSKNIKFGVAVLNIHNGQSYVYEKVCEESKMYSNTLDDIEKYVSIYQPNETVCITNLDVDKVAQFTGMGSIHRYGMEREDVQKCTKQTYVRHILNEQFGDGIWESAEEFQLYPLATQAFCYLLHFIQCRNVHLIRNIHLPIFQNASKNLVLANHTLRQLNIVEDGERTSVLHFLNKCETLAGKRKFQYTLTHPSFDEAWIKNEYLMMNQFMAEDPILLTNLRKLLGGIRDFEKLGKRLLERKLVPSAVYDLYASTDRLQQIDVCLPPWLQRYLFPEPIHVEEMLTFLQDRFLLDECKRKETNIIRQGVSTSLDEAHHTMRTLEKQLLIICSYFNDLFVKKTDCVKMQDKLITTKVRADILKKRIPPGNIELDGVAFVGKDVLFVTSGKNVEIQFPVLNKICIDLEQIKIEMSTIMEVVYKSLLSDLEEKYYPRIEAMAQYTAQLDVLLTKCYLAKKYHYVCPELCTGKSFIAATGMRHLLIEQIQNDELYVPNDITLGKEKDGILLFGTNAVGKTSLIRALGICTILAQAGMYVPCTSFRYSPYTAIYSRIIGNDNLFKGLSTYAVEISELRTILQNANEYSLVLGDELCSGTETESALSIVMASLLALTRLKSSFVLATHFHELVEMDEMKTMSNLQLMHLAVWYDETTDALIYDRTMKEGSGQRTYGLEVCKSLFFPADVLEKAYEIRRKYGRDGGLSFRTSRYNAKKINGLCELCGEGKVETHHLQEQYKADEDGFIGSFHKNHPANLLSVCETCHHSIHSDMSDLSEEKIVRKKSTKGMVLVAMK